MVCKGGLTEILIFPTYFPLPPFTWIVSGPLITTAILSIKKFSVEGVEFQKLLEYSEKRIVWIHANFLPSLAFILFPCKNVTFYTKQDFSRALSFPHHTLFVFWLFFWFLSESTDCERKSLDFEGHQNLGKCDDITNKHIYIQKSQMRLASGRGNPGSSRTWPTRLRSDYKYNRIYLKVC